MTKEERYEEAIDKIIMAAQNINDPCDFGINVAKTLEEYGLISGLQARIVSGEL